MDGWVKTYRKLLEWEWHTDPAMMTLWVHLLLLASSEDKSWRGVAIKRGQLVTSRSSLASYTGLSEKTVRTCLKRLKDCMQICSERANNYTIITICSYDSYQLSENPKGQRNGQQRANETANKGPAFGPHRKNIRSKEIKTSTDVDAKRPSFVEPDFAEPFEVWLEYKRQRKQTYSSEKSLKACYNKIVRLAGGDPAVAMAIVEQSMANNWAGLFELKKENDNGDKQQGGIARQLPGGPQQENPLAGYEKIIGA